MSSGPSSLDVRRFVAALTLLAAPAACGGSEFSAADREPTGGSSGAGGRSSSGGSSGSGGSSATGASGGSGGSGGSSGSGGAFAGCVEYFHEYCAWAERCDTYLFGGSVAASESVPETSCAAVDLPGITITAADYATCAANLAAVACTGTLVTCDLPNGTIANGFGCASASQCESGYCTGGNGACGICAPNPRHPVGGECENPLVDCEADLDCAENVCTPKREEGEPCDDVHHCETVREQGSLECLEGTCTAVGLPGQPCRMGAGGTTTCGYGTACTTENVCVVTDKAGEGDECGVFADRVVVCPGGMCVTDEDDATRARCVNWGKGGESCQKIPNFERCAVGLVCTNSLCAWPKVTPPPDDCN